MSIIIGRIVSELMEEAKLRSGESARDDGMREIFLKILENPALDMRDKKAAIIDFITAGIETVGIIHQKYNLSKSLIFYTYNVS